LPIFRARGMSERLKVPGPKGCFLWQSPQTWLSPSTEERRHSAGRSIFDTEGNSDRVLVISMGSVIRGSQIFAPGLIAKVQPCPIPNAGSKQGITVPPGDPACNIGKS